MSESAVELPSFGGSLAVSFLSLGVVCLVAYVALTWLSRRMPRPRGGMRVVARHQLEPKRSLYVVQVAERWFLLGAGEGGMNLIAELSAEDAERVQAEIADTPRVGGLWALLQGVGAGKRPVPDSVHSVSRGEP